MGISLYNNYLSSIIPYLRILCCIYIILNLYVRYVLFIYLCAIAVYYMWKYLKRALNVKNEWECIGEITQIFIYPIDGGPALPVNRALCTRCGFRSGQFQDRSIIPYWKNSNSAVLALTSYLHPFNHTDLFNNLRKSMTNFRVLRNSAEAPNEIEINYLGDQITVLPFNPSAGLVVAMKNFVLNLRFGYFDVTDRGRFMNQIRDRLKQYFNIFLHGFPSNYSTFTLVDEENFQEFQIYGPHQINFKPQLVIKGKIPLNASVVRIGGERSKIKFINITPCNLVMPSVENKFHGCLFGFNMELKNQTIKQFEDVRRGGMVHVGDKVFVKNVSHTPILRKINDMMITLLHG